MPGGPAGQAARAGMADERSAGWDGWYDMGLRDGLGWGASPADMESRWAAPAAAHILGWTGLGWHVAGWLADRLVGWAHPARCPP